MKKDLLECAKWHEEQAKKHLDQYRQSAGWEPTSIAVENRELDAHQLHERFAAACRNACK